MRYEVKIGILAIIAIAAAFWGYKFIQGTNLFSSSNVYHAYYDNVAGLTIGTPVQISGVNVGSVSDIQLDQQVRTVRVELDIKDGVNVPKETVATIATISLLGEKAIELTYDKPCFGDGDCLEDGSEIKGASKSILASFTGGEAGDSPLDGIKEQLGNVVDSLEYMLFSEDSDNPIARSTQDLAVTMENLKYATGRLQNIMDANAGEINATFDNLATVTGTLSEKQAAIAGIIDNADQLTGKLSAVDLDKTMAEVNGAVADLRATLTEADKAMGGVTAIMNKVNDGKGTLGKLLSDDARMYYQINSAMRSVDSLTTDLEERPYRYVPFKGRKRVLRYDRKDAELEREGN
ncbi:MAG: MlaD family protein [Bacteroidota bacterium]